MRTGAAGIAASTAGFMLVIAVVVSNSIGDSKGTIASLDLLLEQRSYLKLETALAADLNLSTEDRAFFAGVMANRRNRASESIRLLQPLIPALSRVDRTRAVVALSTLADDYEKTFQYAAAADTYANLAQNFAHDMSSGEFERVKQEAARWDLLRRAPAQTARVSGPFTVETTRNRVGLVQASVSIAGQRMPMILDTGANLSVMSRSTARRLRLRISSNRATTSGMTADLISAHVAVLPELQLGKAQFWNVAVVIVEDKDMFVSSIGYALPGSLGFPVLSALGRITFFADGRFGVGLQDTSGSLAHGNLLLQRLTPIVSAGIRGKEELFTIDTGSTGSFLSSRYYSDFSREFASQVIGEMILTGAGGMREFPTYRVPHLRLNLGGASVQIDDIPVLIRPRGIPDDYFYGNLGQTAFSMFPSYTFDFKNMSFTINSASARQSNWHHWGGTSVAQQISVTHPTFGRQYGYDVTAD